LKILSDFSLLKVYLVSSILHTKLKIEKELLSQRLFLLLVAIVTLVFFGLIRDFGVGIFWAIVLSILFSDSHQIILSKFKGKENLAAALTLIGILLMVIIPVALLSIAVTNESIGLINDLRNEDIDLKQQIVKVQDWLSPLLNRLGIPVDNIESTISGAVLERSGELGKRIFGFTTNIFNSAIQIAIMLYVLFFFLRDGKQLRKLIIRNFPLMDSIEHRLFNRFQNVTKATVKGSLLIAILQGVLGGILFLIVGVKGAVLWGALMILASLLPIGGVIIWGPIAAIYLVQGHYLEGVAIILVGALLIGLLDNVLRPRLVGNDTKLPDYIILISTLGGITWFGLSGFVLGPVIAALFITCWQMVGETYGRVKKNNMT